LALPQKVPGGHTTNPFNVFYTVIAQSVEHGAFNSGVRGSSPRDGKYNVFSIINRMKVTWYIIIAVAVVVALVVLLKRRNSKSREMDFKAAGIVFADDKHILGAVQIRDGVAVVDGVGGGRDDDEDYVTTAFREAFEELLEPPLLSKQKELIPLCVELAKQTIKPKTVIRRGSYMMLVCSLDDLVSIMKIAKEQNMQSTVYNTIPTQIDDIVNQRRATEESEFKKLYLIPLNGAIITEEEIYTTFDEDIKIVSDLAAGSS